MRPLLRDMRQRDMSPDTRIYLSWGSREAVGSKRVDQQDRSSKTFGWNRRVAAQASSAGAAVMLHCQVGGEADWEKQVPLFMDFLWMQ